MCIWNAVSISISTGQKARTGKPWLYTYPPPKSHVHLLVPSIQGFYSFPCTEQMCSPEDVEHIDTWDVRVN